MRLYPVLLICVIGLSGCKRTETLMSNGVVDLAKILLEEKEVSLSELSDSIEYVSLETNDSILLHQNAHIFYADTTDIFVRSKQILYHFDSKGNYLNKIERIGNGAHEYHIIYNVSVDNVNKRVFLYIGQKKIYIIGYDGTFLNEITLKSTSEVVVAYILNANYIIAEIREYSKEGMKCYLSLFDLHGNCVKDKMALFMDDFNTETNMYTTPIMYKNQDSFKYLGNYSKYFYKVRNDTVLKELTFDLKEFQPNRDIIEDMNKREMLLKNYASIVDVQESSDYLFLLVLFREKLRGIILDKKTGGICNSSYINMPQRGGGIKNDYFPNSHFWPTYMDEKMMYSLLPIEEALQVKEKLMFDGKKFQYDDNPIVLKVHLK